MGGGPACRDVGSVTRCRYNSIGCSGVIAIVIALIATLVVVGFSMPIIKTLGADAGKLIFLLTWVSSGIGFVYCLIKDHNTVVEIKTWWWEFLWAIFFWVMLAFGYLYFAYEDVFEGKENASDPVIQEGDVG